MSWQNQSSISVHLLGETKGHYRQHVAKKNADGATKVVNVVWFPLQDALRRFVVKPFNGPWTPFDIEEKRMSLSISIHAPKEEAKHLVRNMCAHQGHEEMANGLNGLIDSLPGNRVSLSVSASTYETNGKTGSSGSISFTSDTMEPPMTEDRVDG